MMRFYVDPLAQRSHLTKKQVQEQTRLRYAQLLCFESGEDLACWKQLERGKIDLGSCFQRVAVRHLRVISSWQTRYVW